MLEGVTMHDPATTSIAPEVKMGRDVILYPGVHVTGHSVIGENCTLKTGAFLKDSRLGEDVSIGAYSYLERCAIEAGKDVAPHSVLSS
jgi:bifunctional UDP-N-acetylglucosamine pyrophosphorylase/glucosamine-1-phosphate N-acetyltransferase